MDKRSTESKKAYQALRDYAHLGPARSLRRLHALYVEQAADTAKDAPLPPTVRLASLMAWSARHDWQARVDAWDRERDEEAERAVRAARLRLALAAEKSAKRLEEIVDSDDEAQARLASGDILDRVGVAKGMTVEVGVAEPDDDWIGRVAELLGRIPDQGSAGGAAGEPESQ